MPITSVSEMQQINTTEWEQGHAEWTSLKNAIIEMGNRFFQHIAINHHSPKNCYWDFKITNCNQPSKMNLQVWAASGNVSIYFADGNPQREDDKRMFIGKLLNAGFKQNHEQTRWARNDFILELDRQKKISFAIFYPGNMTETERAKWQVKQLIALSQLVSELYQ